jgi:hypothetical protein
MWTKIEDPKRPDLIEELRSIAEMKREAAEMLNSASEEPLLEERAADEIEKLRRIIVLLNCN